MINPTPNLKGLFGDADDDEEDETGELENDSGAFQNNYETHSLVLGGKTLNIRQFSFHKANANAVWPGTFRLAECMSERKDFYRGGRMLELGSACGALAIWLTMEGFDVVTSDIDDGGDVESNIQYNFGINSLPAPTHIPYTWSCEEGAWKDAVVRRGCKLGGFRFVCASDILLYVAVYPQLVNSLVQIFDEGDNKAENESQSAGGGSGGREGGGGGGDAEKVEKVVKVEEFIMSWNRRIAESAIFFELMKSNGFECVHVGKCIYSFTRPK